jgi:predicted membrane protein
MDKDEKNRGKPPAWTPGEEVRERIERDVQERVDASVRRSGPPKNRYGSLMPGAIILAVGIIFLLDSLGFVRARQFLQFWPMILVLLGASKLARHDSRLWGAVLLLFGVFLELSNLGVGRFTWAQFWPTLLIIAGLMAMWSALKARRLIVQNTQADLTNTLDESTIFGGIEKRLNGREFRGGRLQALFGGIELDLRDAEMAENEAVIYANAIFGGIEVRVPETWYVTARGQGVFGGFSDSTRYAAPAEPEKSRTLIVFGTSLFGGVEIRN